MSNFLTNKDGWAGNMLLAILLITYFLFWFLSLIELLRS
jgi:hypothetical protein